MVEAPLPRGTPPSPPRSRPARFSRFAVFGRHLLYTPVLWTGSSTTWAGAGEYLRKLVLGGFRVEDEAHRRVREKIRQAAEEARGHGFASLIVVVRLPRVYLSAKRPPLCLTCGDEGPLASFDLEGVRVTVLGLNVEDGWVEPEPPGVPPLFNTPVYRVEHVKRHQSLWSSSMPVFLYMDGNHVVAKAVSLYLLREGGVLHSLFHPRATRRVVEGRALWLGSLIVEPLSQDRAAKLSRDMNPTPLHLTVGGYRVEGRAIPLRHRFLVQGLRVAERGTGRVVYGREWALLYPPRHY